MALLGRGLTKKNNALQNRIKILEERLTIATNCLEKISEGNFDFNLHTVEQGSSDDESKNFIHTLSRMNDRLMKYAEKDHERNWAAKGMSAFMDLVQGDNRGRADFYDRILSMVVTYLGVNQGGLFTLNADDPTDVFLEIAACYAYGKKKFSNKRVNIGEGLLGQCYLEKETARFTSIPQSYATITSGLGEATPGFLLLVPMKYNEEVLGVIELASFQPLPLYKIEFIEKIAENVASLILNIQNSNRADHLFKESQEKAKMLQEKEEMLHQNLEELVATQEEMKRNQSELDRQTELLRFILDNIPFPVFVKDEEGRYTLVNKAEAKLFNLDYTKLLGKDDSHFVNNADEWKVIKESDEKVLTSDHPVELPLQHFTTSQGNTYIFKTTKIPFLNNVTGKKNILGVSIDLTEKTNLEKRLFQEKKAGSTHTLMNVIGRQVMLSQKIGFYTHALAKGKKQNQPLLQEAIDLHEHSLQIIRYGGMPIGVGCETPLPKADAEFIPFIEEIEKTWWNYKKAAENIIHNSGHGNFPHHDGAALEKDQDTLEQHGELIMKLNNDLMLACIERNQTNFSETY